MPRLLILALFLVGCAAERTTLDGIPKAAAAALKARAGNAELHISQKTERGDETYEASWKVNGRGDLVELEEEVLAAQVPQPVRDAAARVLPGAMKLKYLRLLSGRYEVESVIDGKERDVTITATGNIVASPVDDDDDDGDADGDAD